MALVLLASAGPIGAPARAAELYASFDWVEDRLDRRKAG
jgi:hypothetical protein